MKINGISLDSELSVDNFQKLVGIILESGEGKELMLHVMDSSYGGNTHNEFLIERMFELFGSDKLIHILNEIEDETINTTVETIVVSYENYEFKSLKIEDRLWT